jgi:hypothetical protein
MDVPWAFVFECSIKKCFAGGDASSFVFGLGFTSLYYNRLMLFSFGLRDANSFFILFQNAMKLGYEKLFNE